MSNSLSSPWILKTVNGLLEDQTENYYSNHNLNPKTVHVIGYDVKLRMLRISDTKNSINVFLTSRCYDELTKDGTTLKDINYCIVKLRHYHISTVVQAGGIRDQEILKKLTFPLVINCSSIQSLGGHGLDMLNDVQEVNSVIKIRYGYYELCDRLLKSQFPYEQTLPDSEGNFCELPCFDDTNPLYQEDCVIPPSQDNFIKQLTSYDRRTNLILLETYQQQKQQLASTDESSSTLHESQQLEALSNDVEQITKEEDHPIETVAGGEPQPQQQEQLQEQDQELSGETLQDPFLMRSSEETQKPQQPSSPIQLTVTRPQDSNPYVYNYETLYEETFSSQLYYQDDRSSTANSGTLGEQTVKSFVSSEELMGETQYDQNGGYDMVLLTDAGASNFTFTNQSAEEAEKNQNDMVLESTQVPDNMEIVLRDTKLQPPQANSDSQPVAEELLCHTQGATPQTSQRSSPVHVVPSTAMVVDEAEVDKLFSAISTSPITGKASEVRVTRSRSKRIANSPSNSSVDSSSKEMPHKPTKQAKKLAPIPEQAIEPVIEPKENKEVDMELEFTQVPTQTESVASSPVPERKKPAVTESTITPAPTTKHTVVPTNPHPDPAKHPKLPVAATTAATSFHLEEQQVPSLPASQDSHSKRAFQKKDLQNLSGEQLLHYRVEKHFPHYGWYTGTVIAYDEPWYRVRYEEDNDQEDVELHELLPWIVAPPKIPATSPTSSSSLSHSNSKAKAAPAVDSAASSITSQVTKLTNRNSNTNSKELLATIAELEAYQKQVSEVIDSISALKNGSREEDDQSVDQLIQDCLPTQPTRPVESETNKSKRKHQDHEVETPLRNVPKAEIQVKSTTAKEESHDQSQEESEEDGNDEGNDDDEVATVTQSPMKRSFQGRLFPEADDEDAANLEREQLTYDYCVERNINPFVLLRQYYDLTTTMSILKHRYPKLLQLVKIFQQQYRREEVEANNHGSGKKAPLSTTKAQGSPVRPSSHSKLSLQQAPSQLQSSVKKVRRDSYGRLVASEGPGSPGLLKSPTPTNSTTTSAKKAKSNSSTASSQALSTATAAHVTPMSNAQQQETSSTNINLELVERELLQQYEAGYLSKLSPDSSARKLQEMVAEEQELAKLLVPSRDEGWQFDFAEYAKLYPPEPGRSVPPLRRVFLLAMQRLQGIQTDGAVGDDDEVNEQMIRQLYTPQLVLDEESYRLLHPSPKKKVKRRGGGHVEAPKSSEPFSLSQVKTKCLQLLKEHYGAQLVSSPLTSPQPQPKRAEPVKPVDSASSATRKRDNKSSPEAIVHKKAKPVEEDEFIATQPQYPPIPSTTTAPTRPLASTEEFDEDVDNLSTTIRSSVTDKLLLPLATSLVPAFPPLTPQLMKSLLQSYTPTAIDAVQYSQYLTSVPSTQHRQVLQELVFEEQELEYFYSDTQHTIDFLAYAQRYPPRPGGMYPSLTRGFVVAMKRIESFTAHGSAKMMFPSPSQAPPPPLAWEGDDFLGGSQDSNLSSNTSSTVASKPIPKEILRIKERHIRSHYDFFMQEKPGQHSTTWRQEVGSKKSGGRAATAMTHYLMQFYTKLLHSQYALRPAEAALLRTTSTSSVATVSTIAASPAKSSKPSPSASKPGKKGVKRSLLWVDQTQEEEDVEEEEEEEEEIPKAKKSKTHHLRHKSSTGNTATFLATSTAAAASAHHAGKDAGGEGKRQVRPNTEVESRVVKKADGPHQHHTASPLVSLSGAGGKFKSFIKASSSLPQLRK